jgi:hypothetical protein
MRRRGQIGARNGFKRWAGSCYTGDRQKEENVPVGWTPVERSPAKLYSFSCAYCNDAIRVCQVREIPHTLCTESAHRLATGLAAWAFWIGLKYLASEV